MAPHFAAARRRRPRRRGQQQVKGASMVNILLLVMIKTRMYRVLDFLAGVASLQVITRILVSLAGVASLQVECAEEVIAPGLVMLEARTKRAALAGQLEFFEEEVVTETESKVTLVTLVLDSLAGVASERVKSAGMVSFLIKYGMNPACGLVANASDAGEVTVPVQVMLDPRLQLTISRFDSLAGVANFAGEVSVPGLVMLETRIMAGQLEFIEE